MASRVSSPVYVGRRQELERVAAALAFDARGTTTLVLVSGEAGVGKSRFIAEVAARLPPTVAVLQGGGIDLGDGSVPFFPMAEVLRGLVRNRTAQQIDQLLGPGRADLAHLLPDLGRDREAESMAGLVYGSTARGRLFEAVLSLLARLSQPAPVVLVIDDLHWADRSTLDLLTFLIHNLNGLRVALLLAYRSDELHRRHALVPFLAEAGRRATERIELGRLDRDDLTAQLEAILGHRPAAALVDQILSRSDGNPYFAEELLAADRPDKDLPTTLRDAMNARRADLSEPAQQLLRAASAVGTRIRARWLASLTDGEEDQHIAAIRELIDHQILTADTTADAEGAYRFRHALGQETVYADLLPTERTRLHRRLAGALAADPGAATDATLAAEIAHHWQAARDQPRALEWSIKAGETAEKAFAFPEALAHFERALELWEQVSDPSAVGGCSEVQLLERAASAAAAEGSPRAPRHIQSALALVDTAADPSTAGLLEALLGRYSWIAGDGAGALAACRRAVELVPREPPTTARARVTAGLGQLLMVAGFFAESAPICAEAVHVARVVGAREIEGHALNSLGVNMAYLGDLEAGLALLEQAHQIGAEVNSPDDVARAYSNQADLYNAAGQFEQTLRVSIEAFGFAEGHGLVRFQGATALGEGSLALCRLGRLSEAEELLKRISRYELAGTPEIIMEERWAATDVVRGRFTEARARLARLRGLLARAVDPQWTAPFSEIDAELSLWQGRPDLAKAAVEEGLNVVAGRSQIVAGQIGRIGPLFVLGLRAEADLLAGARRGRPATRPTSATAAQYIDQLRMLRAEIGLRLPAFGPLAEAYASLGEAELSRAMLTADPAPWAAAVAALDRVGMRYLRAYALWRQAEALLLSRRQRASAASLIQAAHALAKDVGATPLMAEVERLAERARVDLTGSAPISPRDQAAARMGLTARESEVLGLVVAGRTNRQIAEALFVTEKTAGTHVSNILGKLGAGGRTEAAAFARRLGLVRDEPEDVKTAAE